MSGTCPESVLSAGERPWWVGLTTHHHSPSTQRIMQTWTPLTGPIEHVWFSASEGNYRLDTTDKQWMLHLGVRTPSGVLSISEKQDDDPDVRDMTPPSHFVELLAEAGKNWIRSPDRTRILVEQLAWLRANAIELDAVWARDKAAKLREKLVILDRLVTYGREIPVT